MTYYRDLSKYVYSESMIPDLNVGWLSRWRPFTRGAVGSEFMEALASQVRVPRNQMRGSHPCYFCSTLRVGGVATSDQIFEVEFRLGSAEIHAISRNGEVFSAPNLIYHYIDRHGYRPPREFVQAIIDGGEGKVHNSAILRLRKMVEDAPRMEDRIDAAIDLIQVSPSSSVNWLSEIVELPSCNSYFRSRVKAALQLL
ncbi:hypothetical protein ACFXCZ_31850 [Streptomyces sp. NPDC059396]|uniref:DUF7919 family protein n=1 Tax=Streptomyces sp. NPDC059396 TaxID=3346819 RepID=UPI0036B5A6EC